MGLRHRPRLVGRLCQRFPHRHASSAAIPHLLTSQIYAEGFGEGAYSRFDVRFYQSAERQHRQQQPAARPAALRVQLFWPARRAGRPFQPRCRCVQRGAHRRHQHAARQPDDELGAAVRRRARRSVEDHAAQRRDRATTPTHFNEQPNFGPMSQVNAARALPQAALDFRWPFMRDSGALGHATDRADRADRRWAAGRRQPGQQVSRTRTASTWSSPTPTCSASTVSPASTGWRRRARECRAARRLVSRRHDASTA